jgi:hypothetical protein
MLKKHVWKMVLAALVFGLSTLSRPVWAAHKDACADDKQKFCASVDPKDHKAMWDCLKKNKDQLSDDCKKQMSHRKHHKKSTGQSGGQSTSGAPANTGAPSSGAAAQ